MHDDELTPEERTAFARLSREFDPGRLLEERTVRALKSRGLIREPQRSGFVLHPGWMVAAAATIVAVFLGGFSTGQMLALHQASRTMVEIRRQDAAQAAAMVQQTGSAYVAALAALADASRSSHPNQVAEAREVAVNSLHAAANEMVRLSPDEPLAATLLRGLAEAARRDTTGNRVDEKRKVAWF